MSRLATKEPGCGLTWGECACVPGSYRRIGIPEVLGHLVMIPQPELSNVNPFIKEIKPVNPKEISPEYSLEALILKLKLQYFGHLI